MSLCVGKFTHDNENELLLSLKLESFSKKNVLWNRNGTLIVVQRRGIRSSWKKLRRNSKQSSKPILVNSAVICFPLIQYFYD